jgi:hypothetical protein
VLPLWFQVSNLILRANRLFIPMWSWSSLKRSTPDQFWNIGWVLSRNFDWLLFTPPPIWSPYTVLQIVSTRLVSSPLFLLPSATSPSVDVITQSRHIMIHSHEAKMRSLPPLHLPVTLRPVISLLEPKPRHWICTTTVSYTSQTIRLPCSTAIKNPFQPWPLSPPPNRVFILPLF